MSNAVIGLIAGLLLAIATIVGGWWGFLGALLLAGIGILIGAQIDGSIDLRQITKSVNRD